MEHKLLFVGDVVLEKKLEFSSEINQLFSTSLVKCCNFEAPVKDYGAPIKKTGPHVQQAAESTKWLKDLGFNLFAMANNHINDYGKEAMDKTLSLFSKAEVVGAGNETDAYAMKIFEFDGVKYGFVAYGENGYGALNGDREFGHAWINSERVNKDIRQFKEMVDVLLVQIHAGVEMLDVPIPEWRKRYKEIADCGADFIIAHHPHVLQGMEIHNHCHIFYSLGNFAFDYPSNHPEWNRGGLLQLIFEDGKLKKFQLSVIEKKNQVIYLEDSQKGNDLISELNKKLASASYVEYVDEAAVNFWHTAFKNYYAKPFNGISTYTIKNLLKQIKRNLFNREIDYSMLWHNMFIESNEWFIKRAIKTIQSKQDS